MIISKILYVNGFLEKLSAYRKQFFEGEIVFLKKLLNAAKNLREKDSKISYFINTLVPNIIKGNPREKILIFTEYKSTQQYLENILQAKYGNKSVSLIHGGLKYEEREESIGIFENEGQFLISTEAGGEGVNLQRACRIMINFDLPWNPMRLVQRIGRLYRYGQQHKVVVFNLHAPQTLDSYILEVLYSRIDQVVSDMANVSPEFREGLESEILGELTELLDISDILNKATNQTKERTQEEINEAIRQAKIASEKQREIFDFTAGFDSTEFEGEFKIGTDHIKAFIEGMCNLLSGDLKKSLDNKIWELKLPPEMGLSMNLSKQHYKICFDRKTAMSKRDVEMIDLTSNLFLQLLLKAKSYDFDGIVAVLKHPEAITIATAILRWQNDHGKRMKQEFAGLIIKKNSSTALNSQELAEWLLSPAQSGVIEKKPDLGKVIYKQVEEAFDNRLSELSNRALHPENKEIVAISWGSS